VAGSRWMRSEQMVLRGGVGDVKGSEETTGAVAAAVSLGDVPVVMGGAGLLLSDDVGAALDMPKESRLNFFHS
jgi:hypothetical protein